MPLPYLLMTVLYILIAMLAAADASLVSLGLVDVFAQLRWLRVHFITLGIITQVGFGTLPGLIASLKRQPRPAMKWSIWLSLNAGILTLIAGFFGINHLLIFSGGVLVFSAAVLLFIQLWGLRSGPAPVSLKFYLSGLAYLLLGIIIGTGLWLNWGPALYIQNPLETHIHANSWGFMSLMFAGLLVDFVPLITGRALGSPKAITAIFWSMNAGAVGLVLGPWLGGSLPPTVVGLVLHISATLGLVSLLFSALKSSGRLSSPGGWHLLSAYAWILAPVMAAPIILLGFIRGGPIESTAPQALIYGWVLQFGIALIPFIARRQIFKEESPALGGCWGSLAGATIGSILVWVSIFIAPAQAALYGAGFALYALALIHPAKELQGIIQEGLHKSDLG